MLVPPDHAPRVARRLDARIIWMSATPLDPAREYLLKHTTQDVKARVRRIRYRLDMEALEKHPAGELALNDIGAVELETQRPVFVDPYKRNRATGSAILIDPLSNETVAACMITARIPEDAAGVEEEKRRARYGHRPAIVSLGAPDAPLGRAMEEALFTRGCLAASIVEARPEIVPDLAAALHRAGLIVIAATDCGAADRIEAPHGATVEQVLELLLERGILHA
jgi:hypothetical protein